MKFELPKADRSRMMELLEYLAQPCKHYPGNRADDLKEAIDVESEWAWMYADLMLRGLELRQLGYGESHHMVPISWYRIKGYKGGSRTRYACEYNYTSLSYAEHIFAHYCLSQCSEGRFMHKMYVTVCCMVNVIGTHGRKIFPYEKDLLKVINDIDLERFKSMSEASYLVTKEGRHHFWEDPILAHKESKYRWLNNLDEAQREKHRTYHREKEKEYRAANPDKYRERDRNRRAANPEKFRKRAVDKYWKDPESMRERDRKRRAADPEKFRKRDYDRYHKNPEKMQEQARKRRAADPEKFRQREKERYMRDREKRLALAKRTYQNKVAAGYRRIRNKETGKSSWVFVGNQKDNKELSPTGT